MRQRKFRHPHADPVVKDQINIQRPRRIPWPMAVPAEVTLQPLHAMQQHARQQVGFRFNRAVQIPPASSRADRNRQPVGRHALYLHPKTRQRCNRSIKNLAAGTPVRTQQQVYPHAGNSPDWALRSWGGVIPKCR